MAKIQIYDFISVFHFNDGMQSFLWVVTEGSCFVWEEAKVASLFLFLLAVVLCLYESS